MLRRGLRFYDTYVTAPVLLTNDYFYTSAGTLCLFSKFYKYVHGAEVKVSAVKDA